MLKNITGGNKPGVDSEDIEQVPFTVLQKFDVSLVDQIFLTKYVFANCFM